MYEVSLNAPRKQVESALATPVARSGDDVSIDQD